MEAFVSSVYLWDDGRIVINYNYTGENNQLTLRQIEQELVDMDGAEGSPLDSSAPLNESEANTTRILYFRGVVSFVFNWKVFAEH